MTYIVALSNALHLPQVTETQSEDPVSLGQQRTAQQTAIIAFTARYYSNLPFQDPQPSLLKEYLPGARSLGCNELQLLNHLYPIPDQKWKAAYAPLASNPPIVPLLGKLTHLQICAFIYFAARLTKHMLPAVICLFVQSSSMSAAPVECSK